MVARHIQGRSSPHHGLNQQDAAHVVWAAVGEVAEKDGHPAAWVRHDAVPPAVAEPLQELDQFQKAAVNVADDVKRTALGALDGEGHAPDLDRAGAQRLVGDDVHAVKPFLVHVGQRLGQLFDVPADNPRGDAPAPGSVAPQARIQRSGQDDEGRRQLMAAGDGQELAPGTGRKRRRIRDDQLCPGEAFLDPPVKQLESLRRRPHVALPLSDDRAAGVRRHDLLGGKVSLGQRGLAAAGRTRQHHESLVRDVDADAVHLPRV